MNRQIVLGVLAAAYVALLAIPESILLDLGTGTFWAIDVFSLLFCPVLSLWIGLRSLSVRELGLASMPHSARSATGWLGLAVLLWCGTYAGTLVGNALLPSCDLWVCFFSYAYVVPAAGPARFLVILYLALSAAFAQELFFRCWLFLYIERVAPRKIGYCYVPISSVAFAATHWDKGMPATVGALMFGIIASLWFLKRRQLQPLMLGHLVNDVFWLLRMD